MSDVGNTGGLQTAQRPLSLKSPIRKDCCEAPPNCKSLSWPPLQPLQMTDRGLPNLITELPLQGERIQKSGPVAPLFVVILRQMGWSQTFFFPTILFLTLSLICSLSWKEGVERIKLYAQQLVSTWVWTISTITRRLKARERQGLGSFSSSFSATGSIPAKGCLFLVDTVHLMQPSMVLFPTI